MQPQPGQHLAALDKKAHDEHSDLVCMGSFIRLLTFGWQI